MDSCVDACLSHPSYQELWKGKGLKKKSSSDSLSVSNIIFCGTFKDSPIIGFVWKNSPRKAYEPIIDGQIVTDSEGHRIENEKHKN